jgi:hypothetical protein
VRIFPEKSIKNSIWKAEQLGLKKILTLIELGRGCQIAGGPFDLGTYLFDDVYLNVIVN